MFIKNDWLIATSKTAVTSASTASTSVMARRDLPDIILYAQARGPQAYIRRIPTGHGLSVIYH